MPKRKSTVISTSTNSATVSVSTESMDATSVLVSPSPAGLAVVEGRPSPGATSGSTKGRKSKKVKAMAVLHIESEEEAMLDGPLDSPCARPSAPVPAPKAPRKARRTTKQGKPDEQQAQDEAGTAKRTRGGGRKKSKEESEAPVAPLPPEAPAGEAILSSRSYRVHLETCLRLVCVCVCVCVAEDVVVSPPLHGAEVGEGKLLYSLPQRAHKAVVLRRPSTVIKSPYLTDVALLGQGGEGEELLCHTPSLGVGGAVGPGMEVVISEWGTPAKNMRNAIGVMRPRASTHVLHHVSLSLPCHNTSTTSEASEGEGEEVEVVVGLHPTNANHLVMPLLQDGLLQRQINQTDSPVSTQTHRERGVQRLLVRDARSRRRIERGCGCMWV
jgi:hypothetical protein